MAYGIPGHGTARISYAGTDGQPHTVSAQLPRRGSAPAAASVVLGKEGGKATCSVSLHGEVVQQATAYGRTDAPNAGRDGGR
ncbi:hypothetical protein [Streptomyces sp. NPDC046862]|uniref:hypothetical protein n=1 Tax=Streptomyces sp. NPDC046862 TaxID=3154603 RepID=UPI003451A519